MGGKGPGRLGFSQDAADDVYHQVCSVNVWTGKQIPKKHGNDTDSKAQRDSLWTHLNLKRSRK